MSAALQQLDLMEAIRRREAGQDLVIAQADTLYRERLSDAIKVLAARDQEWFSDDVRRKRGQHCPHCGRANVEVFYKPHAQKASYRCVGIGHGGGCGHEWTEK